MIGENQREGSGNGSGPPPTLGQSVEAALVRLKTVWRRHEWTPELLAEYRRVLTRLGDPTVVEAVTNHVIDATTVNYPPPPGVFARAGEEIKAAGRHKEPVVPDDWHKEPVDLEAIAAEAPPLVAAAINRARARIIQPNQEKAE